MRCRWVRVAALALALAAGPANADDVQDPVDRSHAKLDEFQAWIGQQIDTLEQEIGELQRELQGSDPAERDRIDEMIKDTEKLVDELREQAELIGEATAEQWEGRQGQRAQWLAPRPCGLLCGARRAARRRRGPLRPLYRRPIGASG